MKISVPRQSRPQSNFKINCCFCQYLKKSEISTYYEPVLSSTTNETILTKQRSCHEEVYLEESISCTLFFLKLCGWVQKQPFGGAPKSTCYYMMKKDMKNSSNRCSFFSYGAVYRLEMLIKMNLSTSIFQ